MDNRYKRRQKTEEEVVALTYKYEKIQEAYERLVQLSENDEQQKNCIEFLASYREIDSELLREASMVYVSSLEERQFLANYDEDNMFYLGFTNPHVSYDERFLFPIKNGLGELNAWVGYDYDSPSKYMVGLLGIGDKKHLMYGIDDIAQAYEEDTIIINEGLFERIRLKEIGLNMGTSLLGKKMSKWHKQFINRFKNVILIPDADEEGQSMIPQWVEGLTNNVCVLKLKPRKKVFNYDGEMVEKLAKDLDDLLRQEPEAQERFKELYASIKESLLNTKYMEVSFT